MSQQELLARAGALLESGNAREAEALLRTAALEYRHDATVHAAWARALRSLGRFRDAEAVAERACKYDSTFPEAWFNLGGALAGQQRWTEAIAAYRKALELRPAYPEALNNLALAFGAIGEREEELAAFQRAVESNPQLAPVWSNFGEALFRMARYEKAAEACERATELAPDFPAAWINLGNALAQLGRYTESLACYHRALAIDDHSAEAWSGRGAALDELGDRRAAEAAHRRAISLAPELPQLYQNYGCMLDEETRLAERIAAFRKAIELDPGYADARWNLALTLLSTGSLREGWQYYGARWTRRDAEPMRYVLKPWSGPLQEGLKLLVWGEQGVGDEILHASMLRDLAAEPIDVTLECDARLEPLFARSFPEVRIVKRSSSAPLDIGAFNAQCPLADLGGRYRNALNVFPTRAGYLKADVARAAEMREWIGKHSGGGKRVVGISWRSKNPSLGKAKTLAIEDWVPILNVPGVTWVNLQYGNVVAELSELERHGIDVLQYVGLDTFNDIDGVAALAAACDLVLTVSNVTAHIAGALGKPVWQLLPRNRGRMWYWFFGRSDSPWYPSMRIFTQHTEGDWAALVSEVASELAIKA